MKKHHVTFILLTLFFTGLIVLWWADYAEIPTSQDLEASRALVLPNLRKIQPAEIQRIEIAQAPSNTQEGAPPGPLVFERRGEGWQMLRPIDTAADPTRVEALAQNLKHLRKTPEAGTIEEPADRFGLKTPVATIRVFGPESKEPLASLDIGKSVRDRLYVRPGGQSGIEVVDARLFQGIEDPEPKWRDRAIFSFATFQIGGFEISGPGRELKAERIDGRWTLIKPVAAPGDDPRIEEVMAELTSLRVLDGPGGFVEDDAKDLSRFGLVRNQATRIEITPTTPGGKPRVLWLGKSDPRTDGGVYAMRGDQDDVILVRGKGLGNLGVDPNALRSKKVLDFHPALASFLKIESQGRSLDLARTAGGWTVVQPTRETADPEVLANLMSKLAGLETSEFFDPSKISEPGLDPPSMRLKLWQLRPGERLASEPSPVPHGDPRFELQFGRHDASTRTVFARLAGDSTILGLPDLILEALPQDALALRERALVQLRPERVTRLTVEQGSQRVVLEHPKAGNPNHWEIIEPIVAPADDEAVTKALVVLTNLRAERLIAEKPPDEARYGLHAPTLKVTWAMPDPSSDNPEGQEKTTSLIVGARVRNSENWYAKLSSKPLVFTISDALVLPFRAELRNHQVISFRFEDLQTLTVHWPNRSLTFQHHPTRRGGPLDWDLASGTSPKGIDVARISSLASQLSRLQTRRYLQYSGSFPAVTGLDTPRLKLEAGIKGLKEPIVLRVGNTAGGDEYYATTNAGNSGTVFMVSGPAWTAILQPESPPSSSELPRDPFAPTTPASK